MHYSLEFLINIHAIPFFVNRCVYIFIENVFSKNGAKPYVIHVFTQDMIEKKSPLC